MSHANFCSSSCKLSCCVILLWPKVRFNSFTIKRLKCSVLHIIVKFNGEYLTAILIIERVHDKQFSCLPVFVCISNTSVQTFLTLGWQPDLMGNAAGFGMMNLTHWIPHLQNPPWPSELDICLSFLKRWRWSRFLNKHWF